MDEVLNRPLPDDAPLWELWLLHGYDDDEFAVFYKAHHPSTTAYHWSTWPRPCSRTIPPFPMVRQQAASRCGESFAGWPR